MPAKLRGVLKWTAADGADGIFAANYTYRVSCKLPPASASGPSAINQTDVGISPPPPPPPPAGSARLP